MHTIIRKKPKKKQQGAILIIGLILLTIVGIAAIASIETSNLDYRMASNSAFKSQSFQASETGRVSAGNAIKEYIYDRSWNSANKHINLSFEASFNPLAVSNQSEDVFDTDTLETDMNFSVAQSATAEKVSSDIYILRIPMTNAASGGGLQQLAGYRGAGKGVATSGSAIYFELRSKGMAKGGAQTVTASEYRAFIQ
ncbi:hypothetical protein [Marinagarivorans algicola]|uniref:hypothetical protein n=1 Tax=Marinagarivorans algicola TaxID=1513270 RepID=UPI0006B61072|nr:hypothetical protein [Marinagarivorans algicola]